MGGLGGGPVHHDHGDVDGGVVDASVASQFMGNVYIVHG